MRTARLTRALSALVIALAAAPEASAQLRGIRYCEVLPVYFVGGALIADVWNTVGLNLCPQADFEALDPAAIAQDLGAITAILNGPRHWTLDFIVGNGNPSNEVMTFGNLEMRLGATVEVPLGGPPPAYSENSVNRDTQFFFFSGSEVYELIDPTGRVYVMQSYSLQVDDTLTEADLPDLGSRLQLPAGWGFRARVVSADYVVEDVAGVATVVQDELSNSYQFVSPTPVEIDATPDTADDTVNLAIDVKLVSVLGSAFFDVSDVDATTLTFGPGGAAPDGGSLIADVNGDGSMDLVSSYRISETGIGLGESDVCVDGALLDATPFRGCHRILAVSRRHCGLGWEAGMLLAPWLWLRRRLRRPA